MAWDKKKAIEHLVANAQPQSQGQCAAYTRRAIEAGGVTLIRRSLAKDYGPSLTSVGFVELFICPVEFQAGDVVVIDGVKAEDPGHMAMYDGSRWISDFVQTDLYPGPSYRAAPPAYAVYRHP